MREQQDVDARARVTSQHCRRPAPRVDVDVNAAPDEHCA